MEVTRRTALTGAVGAAALVGIGSVVEPQPAAASSGFSTVILSPHQDDETIRLSGYIAFASDRGDSIRLVTATNGAATSVRDRLGITKSETTKWRYREQDHAWDWLTNGRGGPIVRLGFEDGKATRAGIRSAVAAQLSAMGGKPELYVATWHHDSPDSYVPSPGGGDLHPDHVACVLAARDLASDGVTVRFARHPAINKGGTQTYYAQGSQVFRVEGAVAAYRVIGYRSVPDQLDYAIETNGRSVITK